MVKLNFWLIGMWSGWDSQVCALRTVKNVLIRIMKSARIRTKSDKTIEIIPMDKWNFTILNFKKRIQILV